MKINIPRLTFAHVRDIRDQTGLDIMAAADDTVWSRVLTDFVWHAQVAEMLTGATPTGDDLGEFGKLFVVRVLEFFPDTTGQTSDGKPSDRDPWQAVFQAAGVAGVEPWGFSMRELLWMAEGAWRPLSAIVAKVHNANCTKRADLITADSVNPYAPGKRKSRKRYPRADLLD